MTDHVFAFESDPERRGAFSDIASAKQRYTGDTWDSGLTREVFLRVGRVENGLLVLRTDLAEDLKSLGAPEPKTELPAPLAEANWGYAVLDEHEYTGEVVNRHKSRAGLDEVIRDASRQADRAGKDFLVYQAVAKVSPLPKPVTPERVVTRAG